MNIDYNAVIEILKSFLENEKTEILGISVGEERQVRDAIKNILTAYEKEKGENVKLRLQDIPLIEGELKAYKDRVNELKQELEKEKEKNKELYNPSDMILRYFDNKKGMQVEIKGFISKDKIKEIIYPTPENEIPIEIQQSEMYKKLVKEVEE